MKIVKTFLFLSMLFGLISVSHAETLKIGTLPAADSLILYVAEQDGFFKEQNLSVEIIPFQSALELGAAMRAKTLDGHFGDIINVLIQNETGAPQTIIATTSYSTPQSRFFGLALKPNSEIKNLNDIKGKVCAIGNATIVEFVLDSLLKQEGMQNCMQKTDIRQIPIRLQMLLSGQIESALLPEPLLSLVECKGAKVLIDDKKLNLPLAVIALRRSEGKDSAFYSIASRFRTALAKAAENINNEPEKYKKMMLNLKLLNPVAKDKYAMMKFDTIHTPLGLPDKEALKSYTDWMVSMKILKKSIPAYEEVIFQEQKNK